MARIEFGLSAAEIESEARDQRDKMREFIIEIETQARTARDPNQPFNDYLGKDGRAYASSTALRFADSIHLAETNPYLGMDGRSYTSWDALKTADAAYRSSVNQPIQKTIAGIPADQYYAQALAEGQAKKDRERMLLSRIEPSQLKM